MLKGAWGHYAYRNHHEDIVSLDPDSPGFADYRWRDLNGNLDYDPGEVNLDPNGPDFILLSVNQGVANPDLIGPSSDEFMLSVEREVLPNLGVRALGVRAITRDNYRVANAARPYSTYNVPITNPDPGPDGTVGTADDPGVNFTYWEYAPALVGQSFVRPTFINDPDIDQTYNSVEVGLSRRYADGWHLSGSYRATKKNVPLFPGSLISETVSLVINAEHNPNTEINTSDNTWEWNGHLSGGYDLPFDVTIRRQLPVPKRASICQAGPLPWRPDNHVTGAQRGALRNPVLPGYPPGGHSSRKAAEPDPEPKPVPTLEHLQSSQQQHGDERGPTLRCDIRTSPGASCRHESWS